MSIAAVSSFDSGAWVRAQEKTASICSCGGSALCEQGVQAHHVNSPQAGQHSPLDQQRNVQQEVIALHRRDTEVRQHEAAHLAAAGAYAKGGPHYDYVTGPDGKRYAVGGEVSLDMSKVAGDPKATIAKAQTVKRAALAPAKPSAQDRRIAAEADRMAVEAQAELARDAVGEQAGYRAYRQGLSPAPTSPRIHFIV